MKKIIGFLLLITAFLFYFSGCKGKSEGEALAERHCQSCHKLPSPDLLDKKTWFNHVLPKMGNLLGFTRFDNGAYFEGGRFPEAMPLADWNKLVAYYVNSAPDSMQTPEKKPVQIGLPHFAVVYPSFSTSEPVTTYAGIMPVEGQVWIGDGQTEKIYRLQADGSLVDSLAVGQGVANVRVEGTSIFSLTMGVLSPSDEKRGSLKMYNQQGGSPQMILDSLQRPVYAEYGDINNDSLQDIVLCEFGNNTGRLSWFENIGENRYTQHVLRPLPGAIRTQIADMNRDGLPDIVALMAQGDEGIFIYYNKGDSRFEEIRVLKLSPAYGSNYFELADFNGDGHPDILATNGDNGDYPPIFKPYHGIRIYLNDGKNNFREKLFLPVNGASKAMARDFDGDGDLDIASISFFPDYQHSPEESFLYWDNSGDLSFRPFSMAEATAGRWLTMDAGDMDKDGDIDIVLGSAIFSFGEIPDWQKKKWAARAPSALILKNSRKVN